MNSYSMYRIAETLRVLLFMTLAILIFNFYPVTAIMIVMIALLNDGAILSIAYDNVNYSDKPEAWNMRLVLGISTVLGVIGTVAIFGLFWLSLRVFHLDHAHTQTMMYLKMSVAGHLTIFLTRTRGPFWSIRPARILLIAVFGTQAVATLIAVYGVLMTPIGWEYAGIVWGYAVVWFFVNDRVKLLAYRIFDSPKAAAAAKAKGTAARAEAAAKPDPKAAKAKPNEKPDSKGDAKPDSTPAPANAAKAGAEPDATAAAKPDSTPAPAPANAAKADAAPDAKAAAKPDAKPAPAPDAKAEAKPDAKADATPDAKPAPTPEAKDEAKPDAKAEAKPDSTPAPAPAPATKADAEPDAKAAAKPDAKPAPAPDAKAQAKPDAKPAPAADANSKAPTDLTQKLVERVHALYEELGREDVVAVQELERAQKASKKEPVP